MSTLCCPCSTPSLTPCAARSLALGCVPRERRQLRAAREDLAEAQRSVEELQVARAKQQEQIGELERMVVDQQAELQQARARNSELEEQLHGEREARAQVRAACLPACPPRPWLRECFLSLVGTVK
jgi:septal ring factor EnvC (AmiA/AmiB activator)